mmetsp:Transcript_9464/g.21343  ORF Transcript_9464/g.21343 Transcript_9464/m.21343 type:complete len:80 (+) Transcript_9464:326-565(+)
MEDAECGALRRFEASSSRYDSLQMDGETSYLEIFNSSRFEWTTDQGPLPLPTSNLLQFGQKMSYFALGHFLKRLDGKIT